MQVGIAISDFISILGVIVAIASIAFGLIKWGQNRLDSERKDTQAATNLLSTRISSAQEHSRTEVARLERKIDNNSREASVMFAKIPTRDQLEELLRRRVGPLEVDVKSILVQVARLSPYEPLNRSDK